MDRYKNTKEYARETKGCDDFSGIADAERCAFGDLAAKDRALLIGDSHARHFWSFVDVIAKQAHVKVYGLTGGECLALEGAGPLRKEDPDSLCNNPVNAYYNMIRQGKYKYVFIGQRWIGYPESQLRLLEQSISTIIGSGAVPVILKPVAENGEDTKDCFYRHIKLRVPYRGGCNIPVNNGFFSDKKQFVNDLIDYVKKRYPSMIVVDPQVAQCDTRECQTIIDDTPLYRDTHHLSDFGSEMLARRFVRSVRNPLEK